MPHRTAGGFISWIAGGFIGWIAMTVIRTERTISNSPLFTLASWAQAAAGTNTGFIVTRGTVRGRGNLAVNTFNTVLGVLFSLMII